MLKSLNVTLFQGAKQLNIEQILQSKSGVQQYYKMTSSTRFAKYLITTGIIDFADLIGAALNFSMPTMYCISTYQQVGSNTVKTIEFLVAILLIIEYFLRLYIAESLFTFLISFSSLLDYASLIPILVGNILFPSYYFLRYFRVLRMACCLRLNKFFSRKRYIILTRLYTLLVIVLSLILICGCAVLEVENYYYNSGGETIGGKAKGKILQFHDIIYFMIVTIGTLGYGDIVPSTLYSKVIVFIGILFTLYLLPAATSDLLGALVVKSVYKSFSYESQKEYKQIILIGRFTSNELLPFLEELMHPDHFTDNLHAVILMEEPPTTEILLMMRNGNFVGKVFYVQGNPFNDKDLERAGIKNATCAVIFTSISKMGEILEDYRSILIAYSLKKYSTEKRNSDIRVCLQLNYLESKELYITGQMYSPYFDSVVCNEELKLKMLAKNCICPGILTIITALLTSNMPQIKEAYPLHVDQDNRYLHSLFGMQNELYRVFLQKEVYGGYLFQDIANAVYKKFHLILIALEVNEGDTYQVYVNPTNYRLKYENYYAYTINREMPNTKEINKVDLKSIYPNIEPQFNAMQTSMTTAENIGQKYLEESPIVKYERKKYLVRQKPKDFTESVINNVYTQKFRNHLIICGYTTNYELIISSLRLKMYGSTSPYIVIITDVNGVADQWEKLCYFKGVFVIKGSPLNMADLEKSGVRKAKVVLILEAYKQNERSDDESETIFIYRTIKNINPKVQIITEISHLSNISFLITDKNDTQMKKYGFWACDPFLSGELCIQSFLDTILCQTFFSPFVVQLINQLLMGGVETKPSVKKEQKAWGLNECSMFLYYPPEEHIVQFNTFGKMFTELLSNYKMIAIGIMKRLSKSSKPYILLNPREEEELNKYDKLYVLYTQEPTITKINRRDELMTEFDDAHKPSMNPEALEDYNTSYKLSELKSSLAKLAEQLRKKE